MSREIIRQQMRELQTAPGTVGPGQDFGYSVELAQEISQESQEIDRLFKVASALEHMRQTVAGVDCLTLEHLALMESVMHMANVPGLSGEHIPNLESHIGQSLSQEGLGDRIIEILRVIRRMIGVVISKIAKFFAAASEDSAQLWVRLNLSRDVWKELAGRFPRKPTVAMGVTAYLLAGRSSLSHDAKTVIRMGDAQVQQLGQLRQKYIPLVLQAGRQLEGAFSNHALREGNLETWLSGLNQATAMMNYGNLSSILSPLETVRDSRWQNGVAGMAPPVLGGRAIIVIDGSRIQPGNTVLDQAIAQQQTKMVFERINPGRQLDSSTATMATMPHNQLNDWLNLVEGMLKELDAASGSGIRNTLNAIDKRLVQLIKDVPNQDQGVGLMQTGLAYGSCFTNWVKGPYLNLLAHSLSVSGALITAANKHMAAY